MAMPHILHETPEPETLREEFLDWVTPGLKAEYINGEIIVHSPAKKSHTAAIKLLTKLLDDYVELKDLGFVGMEKMMVTVGEHAFEPDVVYFDPANSARQSGDDCVFSGPALVIEVLSPATQARDRNLKHKEYAASGVQEYWIVDADNQSIEQFLLIAKRNEYGKGKVRTIRDSIASTVLPGLTFPVLAAFDGKENLRVRSVWLKDL